MIFTPEQIAQLLEIVDYHTVLFGAKNIGKDILSLEDKKLLRKYGIDVDKLPAKNYVENAYKFGRLAKALGDNNAKQINYNDFKKYLRAGRDFPYSTREVETIKYLKNKTYGHLKDLGKKMGNQFKILTDEQSAKLRANTEKLIKEQLKTGAEQRETVGNIARELGKKTGNWQRDWGRIVETELHSAYEEGRAAMIKEQTGDEDPDVYKQVYPGSCRHCIKAYLTKGLGSKPKIFKLSELTANGTNVGRKVNDWKPVLGYMHPYCRCTLEDVPKGKIWDDEKGTWVWPEDTDEKPKRNLGIKIQVGDKKFTV